MKMQTRRYFFTILFMISIIVGALHTMGHAHAAADHCQVCVLEKLSHGDLPATHSYEITLFAFVSEDFKPYTLQKPPLYRSIQARAPPLSV